MFFLPQGKRQLFALLAKVGLGMLLEAACQSIHTFFLNISKCTNNLLPAPKPIAVASATSAAASSSATSAAASSSATSAAVASSDTNAAVVSSATNAAVASSATSASVASCITTALALIGNPGTGKSTMLNGLVDAAVFSAGLSFGTGRTAALHARVRDGVAYIDTPGLKDISKRRQAARELDRLLRADVPLKLVFVVVVLSGRVRVEDADTMRAVLEAIESVDVNDRFGVVVNCMPRGLLDVVLADPAAERNMREAITGAWYTSHWCYVRFDAELDCKEDGKLATPELQAFFEALPETRPVGASVRDIESDWADKMEREKRRMQRQTDRLELKQARQTCREKCLMEVHEKIRTEWPREREAANRRKWEIEREKDDMLRLISRQTHEQQSVQREVSRLRNEVAEEKSRADTCERRQNMRIEQVASQAREIQRKGEIERAEYRRRIMEKENEPSLLIKGYRQVSGISRKKGRIAWRSRKRRQRKLSY